MGGGGGGGGGEGERRGVSTFDSRAFAFVRSHFVFIYSSMCNSCMFAVLVAAQIVY